MTMNNSQVSTAQSVAEENSAHENWELTQKAKREAEHESLLGEMAAETGIGDREVLEKLLRFDICPDTVRALEISPLFFVAWSDGDIDHKEDEYIHEYIKSQGMSLSGATHQLVSHWFNVPPAPEYFEAWRLYISSKMNCMNDAVSKEFMKNKILTHIKQLAEVSGGFLGLGSKISVFEHEELKKFREAFPA